MNNLFKSLTAFSFVSLFSVFALANAGTIQISCDSASGHTNGSLSFVGTEAQGRLTLNDKVADVSGSYIVRYAGSFCSDSDVTFLSVFSHASPMIGF